MNTLEEKTRSGQRISTAEALEIYHTWDLLQLGTVARHLSQAKNGQQVGFIIDRNINYTNVCVLSCGFCNFYRRKSDEDHYTLSYEQIDQKIEATIAAGGTGMLMQGGHHPDYQLDWYEALLSHIHQKFPSFDIHAFSPPEIYHFSHVCKKPVREILERLKAAGLKSIPGGGGEILVDRVRKKLTPGKVLSNDWLEVSATAHELGIPTSATMMFGHIETIEDRLEHLEKVRQTQDRTGGFFSFIPWTYQHVETALWEKNMERNLEYVGADPCIGPNHRGEGEHMGSPLQPPIHLVGSHEYLRMLALSRIFLDNFKNIQVSWLTQGVKVGQIGLQFGANDMGSIMMEENVISQAGAHHQATTEDLTNAIRQAGFTPRKRDSCYRYLD